MSGYYVYLISSLPMLSFGAKPPFSTEKFIKLCQNLISEGDFETLQIIFNEGGYIYEGSQLTLKKFYYFDKSLRNELVKIRAGRKHIDPTGYLRQEEYAEPVVSRIAISALRNPSVLEAECILDEARWKMLDELSVGHYFDLDFLIVFGCKLLILEKWDKVNSADKSTMLEETLKKLQ